jgi:aldehyde dehydrogenase (NAD+)
MKSILEKYDLINVQAGAGSGEELACSGDILQPISPIDLQPLGKIRCVSTEDYEKIVARATEAFKTWRMIPAPKRGEIVRQVGDALRDHKKSLAEVLRLEVGKIRAEAEGEVQVMIDMADFAVGQSKMLYGLTMPSGRPDHRMYEAQFGRAW